ncbi:hypothetical protein GYMLUDRAFT_244213 [Collybiopsis luxurians FD-317 M1]|uniref:Uncharacterized protein n=1 Tax=Collybiopsis luxurians FD-317 M1 TaxID=944289 RepID=A0A0D0BAB7_9AGAR|nr:hypothetical protein GYMLUDRAFT_244213 [Collybiopsis luxurians FD-317 M1]
METRPTPVTLQLVSLHERYNPTEELAHSLSTGREWDWLEDNVCPFDFTDTQELAVGDIVSARRLIPHLFNLRTFEFASLLSPHGEVVQKFIDLISLLPPTLHTFVLSGNVGISYYDFCRILLALGQHKQLLNISIPNPYFVDEENEIWHSFSVLSPRVAHRPGLNSLQLITHWDRRNPRQYSASSNRNRDCEWIWLEDGLCPFDLHTVQKLVIGGGNMSQQLLPIIQNHLTHLELCFFFDTRESYTKYGSFLQRSVPMFSDSHSSDILQ